MSTAAKQVSSTSNLAQIPQLSRANVNMLSASMIGGVNLTGLAQVTPYSLYYLPGQFGCLEITKGQKIFTQIIYQSRLCGKLRLNL